MIDGLPNPLDDALRDAIKQVRAFRVPLALGPGWRSLPECNDAGCVSHLTDARRERIRKVRGFSDSLFEALRAVLRFYLHAPVC